jgi:hypothetical protein
LRFTTSTTNDRGRAALEYLAPLHSDHLEGVEPLALHLRWRHLHGDPRQVLGQRLAHRLAAQMLRHPGLSPRRRLLLCVRLAQQEAEHRQGELCVVAAEALGLLADQPALELLDLFARQQVELSVLVALALEPRQSRFQIRDALEQPGAHAVLLSSNIHSTATTTHAA